MSEEIKEELREKLRIWVKNRQALFELAGLIYELKSKNHTKVSAAALYYRVKTNLEDPEVSIDYWGFSLLKEYSKLNTKIDEMAKQYSNIDPELIDCFKTIRSTNMDSYIFNSRIEKENGELIQWSDERYNLLELLANANKIGWIRDLLTSNIHIKTRINMLDTIIRESKIKIDTLVADNWYPDSVYPATFQVDDIKESKEGTIQEIEKLIKIWSVKTPIDNNDKYHMIDSYSYRDLEYFQKKGIIDFIPNITYNSEFGTVAVPAKIYIRNNYSINITCSLYDTESYKKLPEEIRKNTDKWLIHQMIKRDWTDLITFIYQRNLELDDEIISELCLALSNNRENLCGDPIGEICTAIEKRSKTPKEYRRNKRYAKQIRDAFDPKELEKQRQEFLLRLMNMNESLQEQVPGKKKIKDLTFRKPE